MCSLLLLFVYVSVFAYKSSIPLNEDTIDPRLDDSDKNCRASMFFMMIFPLSAISQTVVVEQ